MDIELRDAMAIKLMPLIKNKFPRASYIGLAEQVYELVDAMLVVKAMNPSNYGKVID
jgi:hypothetical protein